MGAKNVGETRTIHEITDIALCKLCHEPMADRRKDSLAVHFVQRVEMEEHGTVRILVEMVQFERCLLPTDSQAKQTAWYHPEPQLLFDLLVVAPIDYPELDTSQEHSTATLQHQADSDKVSSL